MSYFGSYMDASDPYVSEKQKSNKDYLMKMTDYWIATLWKEKTWIKTARNYYEGFRDPREYAYLERNYGLGSAMKLNFTPIAKTRIDLLIGLLLDNDLKFTTTVTDQESIDDATQQRRDQKLGHFIGALTQEIEQEAMRVQQEAEQGGEQPSMPKPKQIVTSRFLLDLEYKYEESYVNDFEKAAAHLINFFKNDKVINFKKKLRDMFLDMLITGECFYRVYIKEEGKDPVFEVVKPENIFFNKNTNHSELECDAIVRREFMTRGEILSRWGDKLSEQDLAWLYGNKTAVNGEHWMTSPMDLERYSYGNSLRDKPAGNADQYTFNSYNVVEVYFIEWLANNEIENEDGELREVVEDPVKGGKAKKKRYRLDRYEAVKIGGFGGNMYLDMGKSKYVPRSSNDPFTCRTSYGGFAYNDRNGRAYSLVMGLKDIQDMYDIIMFHRDNLIANSGVNGSRVNIAAIPKVLGTKFMDRFMKWQAIKKNGHELIDPTEEGAELFQHYGDFKNGLDGNAIDALNGVLESLERQADIITGVNKQMYGQIEQRDAVSNVKTGIKQSSLVTKDLFHSICTAGKNAMVDLLNISRFSYKDGKKGAYVLEGNKHVYDLMPEHFAFSDFDINVSFSAEDLAKLEGLKQLGREYVNAGFLDPDVLTTIQISDSITEVRNAITNGTRQKKAENDVIAQLEQQVQQLEQQLQQAGQTPETQEGADPNAAAQNDLKAKELELKKYEIDRKLAMEREKLDMDKAAGNADLAYKQQVVALEREQMYLGGNAAEINKAKVGV